MTAPLFAVTFFDHRSARSKREVKVTLPELREMIEVQTAERKDLLPLLKLARFCYLTTDKACLRHDANDPATLANRNWKEKSFPDHPYGQAANGTLETLARIERADLQLDRHPGRRRDLVKQWRSQVAAEEGRRTAYP